MLIEILLFASGAIIAGIIVWILNRQKINLYIDRIEQANEEKTAHVAKLDMKETELSDLKAQKAKLESDLENEKNKASEKIEMLEKAGEELSNKFKALSADALKNANDQFLTLAKETMSAFQSEAKGDLEEKKLAVENLVKPMKESLEHFDNHVVRMEKNREGAYHGLLQQVKSLSQTEEMLKTETNKLVSALKSPTVRGRWGELQLRRVFEMSGLVKNIHYKEQESVNTDDGRLRPDFVVYLPGGKQIVIDAKTSLSAYLEALEAPMESARLQKMKDHAAQVKTHLKNLASKSYFSQFESTPEFVVMFLPGESYFSAALEQDPTLIEFGVEQKVIISSPTTVIALLRAVSYGWQQEKVSENAANISKLGRELYDSIRVMGDHFAGVGKNLERSLKSYNSAVGSLERNVLSKSRKFTELGVDSSKEIPSPEQVDLTPRRIQSSDLISELEDLTD